MAKTTKLEAQVREPFLFRFMESDHAVGAKSMIASPERGGESNPKEEEPSPEPTKKGPWGD
jgi:hypothetical protein